MRDMTDEIIAANKRIKDIDGGARETPLDYSGAFSESTGTTILLKGEHLQRTGSFKMRGAMNKVLCLTKEERDTGIVAASSGNHGIATAQAARVAGLDASIYLPQYVSSKKHSNMKRLGANTVLVPGNGVEAEIVGRAEAEREGKTFVSPYADRDVIAGQGTIGLELAKQCPDLAAVYLALGGGGLVGGVGCYLKANLPNADIIACSPENAPAMYLCLEKGEIYDTPETDTVSDGTAGGIEDGAITFEICQQVIDRHILVSEAEIAGAMGDMATNETFIIEGAAGVALAAGLKDAGNYRDKSIAVVVCGRNIALDTFRSVLNEAALSETGDTP